MSQFNVDKKKIKYISQKFAVAEERVEAIYTVFKETSKNVRYQYLAHVIRTMEQYIRIRTDNPLFQINCYPLTDRPALKVGCAQYFPGKCFSIFFDATMDEKQLRVCLAHELGHLFLIELVNGLKNEGDTPHTSEAMTEPLSSIFGIFTILDKNRFYEKCCARLNHNSWEGVVDDFILLQKRP